MAFLMHWTFNSGTRGLIRALTMVAVLCTPFLCMLAIFTGVKCHQMIIRMPDIKDNGCTVMEGTEYPVSL